MFEFSPDARFEFLHPADAGTAFARAVGQEESFGIGPIPVDAYVRTRPARFVGDWVDTEESQRLLQYQTRGLDEQLNDMKDDFGILVPIIGLMRPLATWFVTRRSAYLKANRSLGVG
jgi:hypothetical protein